MNLTVKGKQLDVGDALRTHVMDNLTSIAEKYFNDPIEANVVFSRDAHLYAADVQIHVGRGIMIHAQAEAPEPYPAFDAASEKLAKQLRRYKRRLRDHHRGPNGELRDELKARQYVIEAEREEAAEEPENETQPVIVAEMETRIETLTVGEAVMRMDLGNQPALMFRNRKHGGLSMVYRRPDGNIGWVDPADVEAANKTA